MCNENRALVLCRLGGFNNALDTTDDDAIVLINDGFISKEYVEDDKNKTNVMFYSSSHSNSLNCIKTRFNAILNKLRRTIYKVICKHSKNSTTNYILMQNGLHSRLGTTLSQSKGTINVDRVLLDNHSTVELFYNASLLTNIRKVNTYLDVYYNARKTKQI